MPFVILALISIGAILGLIGGLWGLVLAFSDHVLWGVAYLLVPFASLAFFIMRWGRKSVRQAFWLWLSGFGLAMLGLLLSVVFGQSFSTTSSGFGEDLSQLPQVAAPEVPTEQPAAALEPSSVLSPQNGE